MKRLSHSHNYSVEANQAVSGMISDIFNSGNNFKPQVFPVSHFSGPKEEFTPAKTSHRPVYKIKHINPILHCHFKNADIVTNKTSITGGQLSVFSESQGRLLACYNKQEMPKVLSNKNGREI